MNQHRERDGNRTAALEAMGYLVLRFWNNEVMQNTVGVLETVLSTVNQARPEPPHPTPLPSGEREPTESVAALSTTRRRHRP